jgi:hypothetical protein
VLKRINGECPETLDTMGVSVDLRVGIGYTDGTFLLEVSLS